VHSVAKAATSLGVWALLTLFASGSVAATQTDTASTPAAALNDADIARAITSVKADPNLATTRTIKTLRWKGLAAPKAAGVPPWLEWIIGLFRWFDQSARLLVWCVAAMLAGLLGVYLYRMVRARIGHPTADDFVAPTHVQDLDIRPESLPADIGSVARALWDRGERRAALALLYRGLLSRLAHVYRVPIRDSSTEGDCLTLAAAHLEGGRHAYAVRLVRVWQRTVYAHEPADTPVVYDLCDAFATALDAPAAEGRI
jgi:uncharacterized protein DUF4129